MLFKPQWDKPSVMSMLLFCESKPADETYNFMSLDNCACAQFSHTLGMEGDKWWRAFGESMSVWAKLDFIAHKEPRTFGALASRLRQEMGG